MRFLNIQLKTKKDFLKIKWFHGYQKFCNFKFKKILYEIKMSLKKFLINCIIQNMTKMSDVQIGGT